MAAFDRLPPEIRAKLNASPISISPSLLAADMRRGRWPVARTMAFIATLEAAGRDALAAGRVVRTATNELRRGV